MVVGAVTVSQAYDGPKVKFRLAHTTPPGNHITLAYQKFADLVDEKSDGRMKVQVFPNAILGSDRVLIEGAQRGSLEMAVSSTPNMANFAMDYQVFDLPYITSPKYQQNLYDSLDSGKLGKHFAEVANSIGLEAIMWAEYGYRNFCSVSREITDAKSLEGLKVRTTASPVEVEVANALGMSPTPIAWGEVYTALQQGTIDAEGNTFPHLFGAKHNEVLRYAMYSYHNYGMQLGVVNKKWWDKLEPSSQKVIRDAAAEAVKYQREVLYPENEKSAYDGFVEGGIKVHTLTDEQMAEFKTLTRPVWDKYLKELPAGLLDMVLETQK
jgi:tripartite ATP-independent transporter DctP family solute receptor